jgi:hydrogenase expression/formation protein HypE
MVVGNGEEKKVLEVMRADPLGRESEIIGEMVTGNNNLVILNTSIGGKRILDMPSAQQLPRIC